MFKIQRGLQLPLLALITLGLISVNCTAANSHAVICYFPSWAVYKPGDAAFDVEDIDPTLCTHLLYAFAGVNDANHTIMSLDPWTDLEDNGGRGAYKRFTKLKEKNDKLKTLLSVGGWSEGSEKFSNMASTKENRAAFIDSVMTYLEKFSFDGLDIDWEYPGQRGGSDQDKANFGLLIQELREVFDPKGYLLTAALPARNDSVHKSYDLPTLDKYLDFLNVMAFGHYGAWDSLTHHIAPLYACHEDVQHGWDGLNVNFTMHYYLSNGASAAKLIMGIPFYGDGFILQDPSQHGLYAPVSGAMTCSPYSVCGYGELCEFYFSQPGWTHVRDPEQQSIYSYKDQYWIGYDDLKSIQLKSEMIRHLGLAGAMVWSIDLDDTRGVCGVGPAFALLSELYHQMNGPLPSTTPGPTTSPGPTSPHL